METLHFQAFSKEKKKQTWDSGARIGHLRMEEVFWARRRAKGPSTNWTVSGGTKRKHRK